MQKKEPRVRPGYVRALVTDIPGAKGSDGLPLKPKPGKTIQIRAFRAKDPNWMRKNGLMLMPTPVAPPMPVDPLDVPVTAPKEKLEPMQPKKVKI